MILRSQCRCMCHEPGSGLMHFAPCCEPDPDPEMTTAPEAVKRARFEAWAVASGYCVYRHSIHRERYLEDRTNDALRGWNAALACSAKGEGK